MCRLPLEALHLAKNADGSFALVVICYVGGAWPAQEAEGAGLDLSREEREYLWGLCWAYFQAVKRQHVYKWYQAGADRPGSCGAPYSEKPDR